MTLSSTTSYQKMPHLLLLTWNINQHWYYQFVLLWLFEGVFSWWILMGHLCNHTYPKVYKYYLTFIYDKKSEVVFKVFPKFRTICCPLFILSYIIHLPPLLCIIIVAALIIASKVDAKYIIYPLKYYIRFIFQYQ